MKAIAVIPKRREVQLIDVELPTLSSSTSVKLRTLEIGVCGTDREICTFEYGTPPPGSEYLVIGHESLGEVVEVGSDVRSLSPGDLAILSVRRPCPHAECLACRAGRYDFCYTGDFTERGIKMAHGFMTEYVVDEEQYLVRLPQSLREIGVLAEPLTIAEKAISQLWQVQQRLPWACPIVPGKSGPGYCHRAVVLGAGPVGLLGAMAFVVAGFQTSVYSRGRPPHAKASVVEMIGATYIPTEDCQIDCLAKTIGGIDVVYEATGASQLSFELMQALGPNAVFIFTGVPGRKGPIALDADRLMRDLVLKNQVIFGTVNAGRDAFEAAIQGLETFAARWPQTVRSLITSRHQPEAYKQVLLEKAGGIKQTIQFAAASPGRAQSASGEHPSIQQTRSTTRGTN